jgi:hypothetical protein
MESNLLGFDRQSGIKTIHHFDHADDKTYIEQVQDVETIIEANKAIYNEHDERTRWADNNNRVASIPLTIYWQLEREGITKDPVLFKKWLNDPDNRVFRTRPGVV